MKNENISDSNTSKLILVTGHPGVGKTTFSRELSAAFAIPLFSKDDMKELLLDSLDQCDRSVSRALGRSSIATLYFVAKQILSQQGTVILEANFDPSHSRAEILNLADDAVIKIKKQQHCLLNILELNFICDAEIALTRFKSRALSSARHRGHNEDLQQLMFELQIRFESDSTACIFPDALGSKKTVSSTKIEAYQLNTTHGDFKQTTESGHSICESWLKKT